MAVITALDTFDVRFQTSRELDGSDAMNPDPDYSAAYVQLRTSDPTGLCGHGFVFTIGRGNDVQTAALSALRHLVVDLRVDDVVNDLGAFARRLTNDSQLRWLGPEKGVMHMAIGAVINAAWDMAARRVGKPVWRLIADMSPEKIADLIDFRYISDALSRSEALSILEAGTTGRAARMATLLERGYPAYTTSPGWLGYSDEKLARLAVEAVNDGFRTMKLKVGLNVEDDLRRCRVAREADRRRTWRWRSMRISAGMWPRRFPGCSGLHHSILRGSKSRPARMTSSAMRQFAKLLRPFPFPQASTLTIV